MTTDLYDLVKKNLTVALTLLTGFTYYCTYQYERGSCDYFNIPYNFIELGISNLIFFVSLFLVVIILVYLFIKYIFLGLPNEFSHKPLTKTLLRTTIYYAGAIFFLCMFLDLGITGIIGITIAYAISAFVDVSKHKVFLKMVEEEREKVLDENPNIKRSILHQRLVERFEIKAGAEKGELLYLLIIIVILLFPIIIQKIGFSVSKYENHWLKLEEKPNLILLKKYGDNYIFRPFEKDHLIGKIVIIRQNPAYPLNLKDTVLKIKSFNTSK